MLKSENASLSIEDNENSQRSLQAGVLKPKLMKDGIGIENFLRGKVILITGATGFLAKVIVEKMLRSTPDVSKIYLMVRGKDKEDANRRLKTEIVDIELFKCLKQKYGEDYEAFMWSKLVAVTGNVGHFNLGMEEDLAIQIAKHVHIIVNSAADTSFDQRYDIALQVNSMGPCNLMDFAKKCKNLELFMHISTMSVKRYSRQGRLMEETESLTDSMERQPCIKSETMVLENEMKLISNYKKILEHNVVSQKMKELGLTRAKEYGWQNTYGFTKALGEMLIDKMRGEISVPIVILRPTGILSTYKEPFPGWIEGYKVADPLIVYYGKGKLAGFPLNPNCVFDIVPVDLVVNATLGAMAKHVLMDKKAEMNIYHISSSTSNPIVNEDFFTLVYQHFKSRPYMDPNGRPIHVSKMKFFNSLQHFSSHLSRSSKAAVAFSNQVSSTKLIEFLKFRENTEHLATIYLPYAFHTYWLDDSKTRGLIESMSEEEKKKFPFDVKSIDWKDYIVNVHIPGLRRHILKEKSLSKM